MAVQTLWLNFGAGGTLISLTTQRRADQPEEVSAAFQEVARTLTRDAGAPAESPADSSPAYLASALLQQASTEFRFQNDYALARATHMGDGYLLTEDYHSLGL